MVRDMRAGALLLCFVWAALAAAPARADVLDVLGETLVRLQSETEVIKQGIKRPSATDQAARDRMERRLIDGQLAFGVGNYDEAAVMLYDYVEQFPESPSYDEAMYYLAEALFQKRDFLASRTYFAQLVTRTGGAGKFYQQSLERLVELSLKLSDSKDIERWLSALDQVPLSRRRASIPYVRGKYAYFKDRPDEALEHLAQVPAGTEYFFQARYLMGSTHVAKGDLDRAVAEFSSIAGQKPGNKDEMRVIELAHMALGRLYYETDQPSRAVDEYTKIARTSDLFDEALYEVSWVYVKDNQYDKALRALELLALADPTSAKMPEVRILEGNLRIRKAQGMSEIEPGNSAEEYAKAEGLFSTTRETFTEPHKELGRLIAERADPRSFLAQITGRLSETFDVNATLPEVAAAWIRKEPEVERVVHVETDLGDIAGEIAEAEQTIERLERALSSPSRVNIFPSLASKRTRATEILEEVFSIRQQLATHERALVSRYASAKEKKELEALQQRRQAVARELASLPNAEVAYGQRIERARDEYVTLDQRAAEVATVIDASQATLVALEKYVEDQAAAGKPTVSAAETHKAASELKAEIEAMRSELEAVRREAVMARDEAGTGDEVALAARELRADLRQALDDEHRYMMRIIGRMRDSDRVRGDAIVRLMGIADYVTGALDQVQETVDEIVEHALAEVRTSLVEEKAKLAAYTREFAQYEAESRELGGDILAVSFRAVRDKFYDVLIRSDIGVIDVAWSQKEALDELARRLGLDRLRELRTLRDEFRDILDEAGGAP